MSEPLPPEILVQQADGTKAKAVLLQWPVNGLPVYAVERTPYQTFAAGCMQASKDRLTILASQYALLTRSDDRDHQTTKAP
jgi:hypothetical protein